jgi:CubicO group peptidase (beta-lactamase class C family)
MEIDRRGFTRGAMALAASTALSGRAFAQIAPGLSAQQRAMGAIADYAEAHLRWFGLPGMTVSVASPSGFSSVVNTGVANLDSQAPITADTLFQIGSISKSLTAAVLHQFASEGRLKLSDRIVAILPNTPLPASSPIEVQHILDHVAGLPGDPALFVEGGLWTAYAPGKHWHYSNTGYDLLGQLAQHVGGKPLDRVLAERLFGPMGMIRTRGALKATDRLLYAQGYEPADLSVPYVRNSPLRPAAWVDSTSAAGSTASTAADMIRYLQGVARAARGTGGMGLSPKAGLGWASHSVPSDSPEMRYGNGLMHVEDQGRKYIHHTGGMVSFSSSFHVDAGNGVGSFASTNFSAFPEYRPRKVTMFAVQALAAAEAGQPIPDPPPLATAIKQPEEYVGRYTGASRSFEVRGGAGLTIVSNGTAAALEAAGGDLFVTSHPDFRDFTLLFERPEKAVTGAAWGPDSFVRDGASGKVAPTNPQLARLAGTYYNDSPWWPPVVVVERSGKLWLGTDTPLVPIGKNLYRVGDESWSPERASFADFMNGKPQTFVFSGTEFARQDV